jgi:peptidoglycan/LPS O-acetylase OafA/YrhL
MLLTKNPPLTPQMIGNFYFRRFKRIIPLYLSVILVGFMCAWIFMSPTDFEFLYTGATRPLSFIANWPNNVANNYFAQVPTFNLQYVSTK